MTREKIGISLEVLQTMREHVEREAPLEACGLVAGHPGMLEVVYPITNSLQSAVRYRMDGPEQVKAFVEIERSGLAVLAIYHSHPEGPEVLSARDIAEMLYPDLLQLLWSKKGETWDCKAYRITTSRVEEVPLVLEGEQL